MLLRSQDPTFVFFRRMPADVDIGAASAGRGLVTELEGDLHEALRRRAFEERRPMTDLIREAVRRQLESRIDDGSPIPPVEDPFFKVVTMCSTKR